MCPTCEVSEVKVTQLCPTLWDAMDYTVHGFLQARRLEWLAFPFPRGSSQPRDWTQIFHIAGRFFTSWATREAQHRSVIIYKANITNLKQKKDSTMIIVETFNTLLPLMNRSSRQKISKEASTLNDRLYQMDFYRNVKNFPSKWLKKHTLLKCT